MTATYWNGDPTPARPCVVRVGPCPEPTWWCAGLEGTERKAVEVTYGGAVFYLDDEDGSGWRKVTEGHGGPAWADHSLPDTSTVVSFFRPDHTGLDLPEAMGNEDSDRYWAAGHVHPMAMVLAVVLDLAENVGPDEAAAVLMGDLPVPGNWGQTAQRREHATDLIGKVRHVWFREHPDDDELMLPAEPGEPGASAWTEVVL